MLNASRRSEERRVGKECPSKCVDLGGRRIIQAEDGIRDLRTGDWSSDVCSSDLELRKMGDQRDSNPRHLEPQSNALTN